MGRLRSKLYQSAAILGLLVCAFSTAKGLRAALKPTIATTYIEIDGTDYGPFDKIEGLEKFARDGFPLNAQTSFVTVKLNREFVTHPSLYLWAKNQTSRKFSPRDIHLITEDDNGNVISRKVLQLCQPLSWSVESSNPSLGGFHETVDLAVQKISVF